MSEIISAYVARYNSRVRVKLWHFMHTLWGSVGLGSRTRLNAHTLTRLHPLPPKTSRLLVFNQSSGTVCLGVSGGMVPLGV